MAWAGEWAGRAVAGFTELVFPPVCVACRGRVLAPGGERLVCSLCWSRTEILVAPRCERCWSPLPAGVGSARSCAVCQNFPPAVRCLRSAFQMQGPVREMLHALKYSGWRSVAEPMGERMARLALPQDVQEEAHLVVPVPTSPAHLRERGYNQAERLAAAFARRTSRRARPELLVRTGGSRTQTALHPNQRRANVAGAFSVPAAAAAELRAQHLLLVDDVWTTGATALECAATLLAAGARSVSVVTFARALPELNR